MSKLDNILMIGAGGVGAPLAIALSNVSSHLHIMDHDTYEISNITRQPVAKGQIGVRKVDALLQALEPWRGGKIHAIPEKLTEDNVQEILLHTKPDLIVCAVDNDEARKIIWELRDRFDILWGANEQWTPQAGLSRKEEPWNPMEAFKPAEEAGGPICGAQTVHANLCAAALAQFTLLSYLYEEEEPWAFVSKQEKERLFTMTRKDL